MAMTRCTTPFQHFNNKLSSTCYICDIDNCFSETTTENPFLSTPSVAADNCDIVENVAFYINMLAQPNTRLPIPTAFDGNNPPFLEWKSEGCLQLNDFAFLTNLDTAFNEVHPVTLNDIYGGRDETEAINNGIREHQAGLAAPNEELAQQDQPAPDGDPARRAAETINADITTVTGQRDALTTRRANIKRNISKASQYLTYILVYTKSPTAKQTTMFDNYTAAKTVLNHCGICDNASEEDNGRNNYICYNAS